MSSQSFYRVLMFLALLSGLLVSGALADQISPGQDERCPVCGMGVAPYPNWVSVVTFSDGERVFFDGPKDLFRFIFGLKTYRPEKSSEDIAEVQVTEYYSTRLTDAKEVYFIVGSDIRGPMPNELVAVAGKQNAEAFLKDHGGESILVFDGHDLNKVVAGE